jgi:two-component system chemotaxis response regulator CheB
MIRVLVVDDSASARGLLIRLFQGDGRFEVVGAAGDGQLAVALTARLRPDVITMDIHMRGLGGLAAIRCIMAETPTPIVVVSASVQEKDVGTALEALKAGAVSAVEWPHGPGDPRHLTAAQDFVTTVRLMSEVPVVRRSATNGQGDDRATRQVPAQPVPISGPRPMAVALAASTGGPQAIQTVLQGIGGELDVPLLIVQHITRGFAAGMASWLSSTCPQRVKLAEQGEAPQDGTVYLAPHDHHLMLARRGTLVLSSAPPRRGFRPSANVLFESVAECHGAASVGVILTGMGDDGAAGLGAMRAAGAATIAQDAATSVVYGMPAAAVAAGAAQYVLPLAAISQVLGRLMDGHDRATATRRDARSSRP